MSADEKDLGVRSEFSGLVPLAEKIDAEKAALRKELESVIAVAVSCAHRGEHQKAAGIFDEIAHIFRVRCFLSDAEVWERRAADARSAERLAKRRKGKIDR
jgi:hypothetical protein